MLHGQVFVMLESFDEVTDEVTMLSVLAYISNGLSATMETIVVI